MVASRVIMGTSTPGQRTAIVVAGRRLGFDLDDLRAFTPHHSLRALSLDQASALLNQLNQGHFVGPRRHQSVPRHRDRVRPKEITSAQRRMLEQLRLRLGWTPEKLDAFLVKRFAEPLAGMTRRHDAARAIAILLRLAQPDDQKELEAKDRPSTN
jgi:hypothetical protein